MLTNRIAVTGATGFIGRHLVADLIGRGVEVVSVGRPIDSATLATALHAVDAVVHLAGVVATVRDEEYSAVNVGLTRAVAAAARAARVRLIYISSLAGAGPAPASDPRSEDDPPAPATAYGRSKLDAERVLAAVPDLRWMVLRPGVVYGPGDRAMLPLFRLANRGLLPLVGRHGAAYTVIHVDDLVRTIAAAIESSLDRETVFAGHPRPVTAREILEGVRDAVGGTARIVAVPMALTRIAAVAGDIVGAIARRPLLINGARLVELSAEGFVCRVDRLRDRLGIVAQVELRAGLARTAAGYREQGWL